MNAIRHRCLILLLCLVLPLSALASLRLSAAPCAMQAEMQTNAMQMQATHPADCCNEQDKNNKPSCKTGQLCQSVSLLPMALTRSTSIQLSRPLLVIASPEFIPVQSANGVWRPPRL